MTYYIFSANRLNISMYDQVYSGIENWTIHHEEEDMVWSHRLLWFMNGTFSIFLERAMYCYTLILYTDVFTRSTDTNLRRGSGELLVYPVIIIPFMNWLNLIGVDVMVMSV